MVASPSVHRHRAAKYRFFRTQHLDQLHSIGIQSTIGTQRFNNLCWLLGSSAKVWQVKPGFPVDKPRSSRCHIADWQLVQARPSRWRMTYCSQIELEGKLKCTSDNSSLVFHCCENGFSSVSSDWQYGCTSGVGGPARASIRLGSIEGDSSDRIEPGCAG
jgi:hypothetical protein